MLRYVSKSDKETYDIAVAFAEKLKSGDVIAYIGGLGAGKTTFTRGLAKGLLIDDPVSSPTFALINEYHGERLSLYHFDMYRITDFDSLCSTGFFDYLTYGNAVLAIEWSENITEELPDNTIFISLEADLSEPNSRIITIEGGSF